MEEILDEVFTGEVARGLLPGAGCRIDLSGTVLDIGRQIRDSAANIREHLA
jgi:hypothetical protein